MAVTGANGSNAVSALLPPPAGSPQSPGLRAAPESRVSVLVRIFPIAVFAVFAISAMGCTPTTSSKTTPSFAVAMERERVRIDPGPRHYVTNTVGLAALEGFDRVAFLDTDLHEAQQTRAAVDVELERNYHRTGHRRWFFYAFDRLYLDFVVARYQPAGANAKSGGARYVAEHRMRVVRTTDAERALGVADTVRQYELGDRGVRPGMGRPQVEAKLGHPQREIAFAPGAFDMLYPSLCVRFSEDRVAHVWQRPRCAMR